MYAYSSTAAGLRRRAAGPSRSSIPATGEPIGTVAHADRSDLDRALEAADKGLRHVAQGVGVRPLQDHAQGGELAARAGRRDRAAADPGAGQAAAPRPKARRWPAPTSSTGSPRRRAAPMAASSRRAPRASISSSSRSRSARSRRSRRGTSRSTRWCANCPRRSRPAARSSSRRRRKPRPRPPS